jgi:transcriptional regulator with PAS, ATPase and Fis domain
MNQPMADWVREFRGAVTVCDREGIVLSMNAAAGKVFAKWGGEALVGKSLLDCHPGPARAKLLDLLRHEQTNVYTIEKNGVKKLIYQGPWYHDGRCMGLVELSLEIPFEPPHFVRS